MLRAQPPRDQGVKWIIHLLSASALDEHARDLQLLALLQAQLQQVEVGVAVVRGGHDGDEDGAADVGVHALLSGEVKEEVCGAWVEVVVLFVCLRRAGSDGFRVAVVVARFFPAGADEPPFPALVGVADVVEADAQRLAGLDGSRVERAEELLHADGVFGRYGRCYGACFHAVVFEVVDGLDHEFRPDG